MTVPLGAAPELPPEDRELLLCVSTNAVRVTFWLDETVAAFDVSVVVVGACITLKARAVVTLLAR